MLAELEAELTAEVPDSPPAPESEHSGEERGEPGAGPAFANHLFKAQPGSGVREFQTQHADEPGLVPGFSHAGAQRGGFPMSRKLEDLPAPGSSEARSMGCICSPQQNRNGAGIARLGRVKFVALYWCPVHGVEAMIEALRSEQAELR